MKNNRKNRKLTYIKAKNNIRRRKKYLSYWFKVSKDLEKEVIGKKISETMAYFSNKYKLDLSIKSLRNMTTGTDFIRNLTTYSIIIEKA